MSTGKSGGKAAEMLLQEVLGAVLRPRRGGRHLPAPARPSGGPAAAHLAGRKRVHA